MATSFFFDLRIQSVDATHFINLSAGASESKVSGIYNRNQYFPEKIEAWVKRLSLLNMVDRLKREAKAN